MKQSKSIFPAVALACAAFVFLLGTVPAPAGEMSGLWVGQVRLNYVNEVPIALDENNDPIAPDPEIPTPTADQAQIRLIIHVNGAGQANLLKEVAVMNRTPSSMLAGAPVTPGSFDEGDESDLSLVTEPEYYSQFPEQAAMRVASAVFDFGESQASYALDAVVDAVVEQVTAVVTGASAASFSTPAGRDAVEASAIVAAEAAADPIITAADVEVALYNFSQVYWTPTIVTKIATNPAAPELAAAISEANDLAAASFFGDTRARDMIAAVTGAVAALGDGASQVRAAHNITAAYLDSDDKYHRFIAGQEFGTMISGVATSAAGAALQLGSSFSNVLDTATLLPEVNTAKLTANLTQNPTYNDTRGLDAIDLVISQMVLEAVSSTGTTFGLLVAELEVVGYDALAQDVTRYPVPVVAPAPGYNTFVTTNKFLTSGDTAAAAASEAAVRERKNNVLWTELSVETAARLAAIEALDAAYSEAARIRRSSIPLQGSFAVGSGDARIIATIGQADPALGSAGLEGVVYLPANHPTNPFRHRRHPDHTTGFNITRNIRIDFDDDGGPDADPGFGVDWISGVYREDISGLHKPLGQPNDPPIGLKTEGVFELRRISTIDALNNL